MRPPQFDLLRRGPRDRGPVAASIAIHVAVIVLLSTVLALPVLQLARFGTPPVRQERVLFVETQPATPIVVPPAPRDSVMPRRAAPVTRDTAAVAPPRPVVEAPPTEIPVTIPPARARGGGDSTDARAIGGGIPGLRPGIKDPRLLGIGVGDSARALADGPLTSGGRSPDSLVHGWVKTYWDSLARAQFNAPRSPGDWTIERGGDKYGADQQWIYFGKFKLPTALLALLPINTTANPGILERRRALETMRFEIEFQAQRAQNQTSFQQAVRDLKARTDAERAARKKQ